ncbi:MAG: excalibur calcium-binding domain-containing protein [Devosia sp.]|uniref:excalibur calcium-binding domain-containing protein n=1 Tax=unclassified Devosia TaxID=196773 RepID=UPI001A0E39BA|nr:excalibur calcium-binding domain-containing protein [Devosia sp. SD17-2]MBF0679596.1 excalibur calcium-binding domain-containing protein [Devosia sp.]WEJ32250.1 excalibur calcium-binding domain-containing protein [Devosia sp. SD17-2]
MKYIGILLATFLLSAPAFGEERISRAVLEETGLTVAQSYSCQPRKTCGRIGSCQEARWYLHNCSWGGRLDGDSDGVPCESICR